MAAAPQVFDPLAWAYVVELNHDRAEIRIFDEKVPGLDGIMVNLEKTTPNNYLRIKPTSDTSPLPFVNVANSGRGTVARIKVAPNPDPANPVTWSSIIGEYFTAPDGRGRNPSRTTVDRYGNVWVGNRNELGSDGNGGSIAQIGVVIGGTRGIKSPANAVTGYTFTPDPNGQWIQPPADGAGWYSTCPDRDGDGLIRTSAGLAADRGLGGVLGWDNAGSADSPGGVSTARDEAILRYVRVFPTAVRSIAVDRHNNIWVGGNEAFPYQGNGWQEYIDGVTGVSWAGRRLKFGSGGYGGLVDGRGNLWSAGFAGNGLLRFVPGETVPPALAGGIIPGTLTGYGLGVDPISGDVWLSHYTGSTTISLRRFMESGCHELFSRPGTGTIKGVAVDGRENVWVALAESGTAIYHWRTSGEFVGTVSLDHPTLAGVGVIGVGPTGVCIDSQGMVWAACLAQAVNNGFYAMRIDPQRNPPSDPAHDPPIGVVVEAVDLGAGAAPYNYSDMSGFTALSTTQPAGFWDFIEDSAADDTTWTKVGSVVDTPADTSVLIETRAANRIADLPSWPFQPVGAGGAVPAGTKGRYLEVRATLLKDFCPGASCPGPELRRLMVEWAEPACSALQITAHPKNQVTTPGQTTSFSVTVSGATSYQWLKDGVSIPAATANSLVLNNVQHTDAGRYSVRVIGAGCSLESAEARLHVKGNAPTIPIAGQPVMSPASPNPGATVTITAFATAAAASGSDTAFQPVYYQWRFAQMPISGASGQCTLVGNDWTTSLTVNDVQCDKAGDYSVVFWNQYGEILSDTRTLALAGSSTVTITPSNVSVQNENQNVTLTATICFPWVCAQWYVTPTGGVRTKIPGADSLTYTLPTPITCDMRGTYTIEVIDQSGTLRQASATVSAPAGVNVSSLTFTVNPVSGTGWSYQWYFQDDPENPEQPIAGAVSASYTVLTDAASGGSGQGYYRVVATGSVGATASARVHLADSSAAHPSVQAEDAQNATVDMTLTSSAVGLGPWTYQWYFRPTGGSENPISGATANQYTISGISCVNRGSYRLRATGSCGEVNVTTTLAVASPSVVAQNATFTINPIAGTGWTYQWYFQDDPENPEQPISGANSASYTVEMGPDDAGLRQGYYRVRATGSGGATATVQAQLVDSSESYPTVRGEDAQNATLDVTFSTASPAGVGPWTYQWYFRPLGGSENPVSGATASQHTISAANCAHDGTYRLQLSDACGRTASVTTTFAVTGPSVVIQNTTFRINPVSGTGWTYQWYFQDDLENPEDPISGATSASFTVQMGPDDEGLRQGYYRVIATGSEGASATALVQLIDSSRSYPSVQVEDTQNASLDLTFAAASPGGVGPWTYQWYFRPLGGSESPISGATGSQHTTTGVNCGHRGSYRLQVNDGCGGNASVAASLSVLNCP